MLMPQGRVVSSCLKTRIVILACLATRRRNSHESKVKVFRCDFPILACGDLHHALIPGDTLANAQSPTPCSVLTSDQAAKIPPDQLRLSRGAIVLYPDPLLAQTLAASTYPLEIIQLQQWLGRNSTLKDKALADAVAKQPGIPAFSSGRVGRRSETPGGRHPVDHRFRQRVSAQ